jgi:hypothetical protein
MVEVAEQDERLNEFIRKELQIRSINRIIKDWICYGHIFCSLREKKMLEGLEKGWTDQKIF